MDKKEYTAPSVIPDPEGGGALFSPQSEKMEAWWKAASGLRPVPEVRKAREDGGFLIVMSARNLLLYFLNGTARSAFLLMDGQRDLPGIAEELAGLYSVEKSRLDSDLKALAYTLEQYGLIRLM
ncbi:MAG: PqqD family protein [Desulfocucumaceae bacterium]